MPRNQGPRPRPIPMNGSGDVPAPDSTGWETFGASVQGASHRRRERPNQDAFAVWADPVTGAAVAAVSDGHGSPLHPRSGIGARLAADLAVGSLRDVVHLRRPPDAETREAALRRLATVWRAAVRDHVAAHPLRQDEIEALTDDQRREIGVDDTIAYGTTILAAAATPAWLMLLQIGDGDALTVDAAHDTRRPLPDDPRQARGRTLSLCHPEAWAEGRTAALSGTDLPALLLLSTDGYVNSFASDEDFLEIGGDYAALLTDHPGDLRSRLPAILDETSTEGSGDDITLAVVHRASCAPAGQAPPGDSRLAARVRRLLDRLR
jgi:hypothetical protein